MAGSIFIAVAAVAALASAVFYYLNYKNETYNYSLARLTYHIMMVNVIGASVFLLYLILSHQFQFKYIYENTSTDLPVGFLISTFWAGQEGSFLFWSLLTAFAGLFVMGFLRKKPEMEGSVMAVIAAVVFFMVVLLLPGLKSPFATLSEEAYHISASHVNLNTILTVDPQTGEEKLRFNFLNDFVRESNDGTTFLLIDEQLESLLEAANTPLRAIIAEGRGLNPLLQNFWMQIHPPILFLGFAMCVVPFAFAMAGLMRREYATWVGYSFPWTLSAMGVLGMGIMLGGYWAYGVLGWGGYWAWDPVENASLVPWLTGSALVHTMIVQRRSQKKAKGAGRYGKANLILAILTFVLVIYSTFLTRSGILADASVHSFGDPGQMVYVVLLAFLSVFFFSGLFLIVRRWNEIDTSYEEKEESVTSRELTLFTSAVALCASALIVFTGTSLPIFGPQVETSFYDEMHLPLAILIGLLNGVSFLFKWRTTNMNEMYKQLAISGGLAVVATVITAVVGGMQEIMIILFVLAGFFTIIVNVQFAFEVVKGNWLRLGAYIGHIGIGFFFLGVAASSVYSTTTPVELPLNQPVQALGKTITFTGVEPFYNNTRYRFNVSVDDGSGVAVAQPVMFFSEFNKSTMREPAIVEGFVKDYYISPLGYDEKASGTEVKSYQHVLAQGAKIEVEGVTLEMTEYLPPDMAAMQEGRPFVTGGKFVVSKDGKKQEVLLTTEKDPANPDAYKTHILTDLGVKLRFVQVSAATKEVVLLLAPVVADFDTQQAKSGILSIDFSIKPFVSLVWIGVLLVFIGFGVAAVRRTVELREESKSV